MTELPPETTPAEEEEVAPAPPPVATILLSFAPGTLDISIASSGIVTQSHLWAASALLTRIADQLWTDGQIMARQKAAMEKAAVQGVLRDLKLPGRRT